MTEKSNFVLIWEINNATATFATLKAESAVYKEGGFRWKAGFHPNNVIKANHVDFTMTCDHERHGEWSCEADLEFVIHHQHTHFSRQQNRATFNCGKGVLLIPCINTTVLTTPANGYIVNDKVVFECRVNIIHSVFPPIPDLSKFCSPNEAGNVTLLIEDKRLRVSKEFLAVYSPVLAALFFGNFAEKNKEEIEIKDVLYEDFVSLLLIIFPSAMEITDRTVPHILMLADRFQMEHVLNLSEKHLKQSMGFDVVKKLLFADQYRLASLRERCLNSFPNSTEMIEKIKSSPHSATFSDAMKSAIYDRIMKK